jgi:hypothetical protein
MDDPDEKERIREQKRQELLESAESDADGTPDDPVEVESREQIGRAHV